MLFQQTRFDQLQTGETPDDLIQELAAARVRDPTLGISGVHLFTFGSLAGTIAWVERKRRGMEVS